MAVTCVCGRVAAPGEVECSLCGRELVGSVAAFDAPSATAPVTFWTAPPPPARPTRRLATPILLGALVMLVLAGLIFFFITRPDGGAASSGPGQPAPTGVQPELTASPDPSSPAPVESSESSESAASASEFPRLTLQGRECGRSGTGPYAAAASGTDVTSCRFALNVGAEYRSRGADGDFVSLRVYSPVTKQWYDMDCTGRQPVTCVGGTNAVVYLYGGPADFN